VGRRARAALGRTVGRKMGLFGGVAEGDVGEVEGRGLIRVRRRRFCGGRRAVWVAGVMGAARRRMAGGGEGEGEGSESRATVDV
jgi:hypothetical protein